MSYTTLPELPPLDPQAMLGYAAIRYIAGWPESYVRQYATEYAIAAITAERARAPTEEATWARRDMATEAKRIVASNVKDELVISVLHDLIDRLCVAHTARVAAPIDMILHCPKCGLQHIDAPEPCAACGDTGIAVGGLESCPMCCGESWANPPHKSHKCHGCGTIWRPADVPTNGVAEIKTKGKADNWGQDEAIRALLDRTKPLLDAALNRPADSAAERARAAAPAGEAQSDKAFHDQMTWGAEFKRLLNEHWEASAAARLRTRDAVIAHVNLLHTGAALGWRDRAALAGDKP